MGGSPILAPETIVGRTADGTIYARSPVPLGAYPDKITERLERWAARAPDRTFLARRDAGGAWTRLTYGAALARVRAIAQSLVERGLSNDRPVVILSGNSIEHALLALAAMYAGIVYVPVAPAYSLLAREFTTLRFLWRSLTPGLVFAAEGARYDRALSTLPAGGVEIVTCTPSTGVPSTPFAELEASGATDAADDAHGRVTPDTIAKVLYTSGSTGTPKGVINTQRMLCSNQEMLRTFLPCLAHAPVLCDWLPWNHTFGGNHNFGIVLYNGGTLYIDDGRPTPDGFETTIRNLGEIATTAYFNVPRGYDLLVPRLREDDGFGRHFFSRLEMLFCAAAALRQRVADDLTSASIRATGRRIPLVTGLGATESAPFALCAGDADFTGGRIGVPVPGVELKVAPVGARMEGRLRGPNITPGYWRDRVTTDAAFDEEGFYKLGDALAPVDPADLSKGFVFEGRLAEDFKLSTGTWVRVGPLRAAVLAQLGDLVHDVVIAAPDRDFVGVLIFPSDAAKERFSADALRCRVHDLLQALAARSAGSSATIRRALLLDLPPAIDAQETTDKGSVNQKAVLANRAALVDRLFEPSPAAEIIDVAEERGVRATHSD